jgi:uncharacterized protein YdeI (BOF family)
MKMFAFVALAALIAFPTVGEAASKKSKARAAPSAKQTFVQPRGPTAYEVRRAHSPNAGWDVYRSNGYVGSDPDPQIRAMLQRDDTFNDP